MNKPGAYDLPPEDGFDVAKAVTLAGGATTKGNLSRVKVARTEGGKNFALEADGQRSAKNPVLIKPGDQITVREKIF